MELGESVEWILVTRFMNFQWYEKNVYPKTLFKANNYVVIQC